MGSQLPENSSRSLYSFLLGIDYTLPRKLQVYIATALLTPVRADRNRLLSLAYVALAV